MADWKNMEEHVRSVFSQLLNLKDEGIVVAHDLILLGRTGIRHQIDVYYEFAKAGIIHRVAIECKRRGRPVEKEAVMAFHAKISDIPGVTGVVVSETGFQSGARSFAADNGMLALEANQLPSMSALLGAKLESVALPDETVVGEPFWAIYSVQNGRITGHPIGQVTATFSCGYLFLSKRKAQAYIDRWLDREAHAVRGLAQRHLRTFILSVDAFRGKFLLMEQVEGELNEWRALELPRDHLIAEWYVGNTPIPEKPFVMPGR